MGKKVIALTHRYIAAISRAEAYRVLRFFTILCCAVYRCDCLCCSVWLACLFTWANTSVSLYSSVGIVLISITFPLFLMDFTFRPHFSFCNGCFRRLILLQDFSLWDQGILNTTYFSVILMIVCSALVQLGERVYFGKKPTSFAVVLFCFNPSPTQVTCHLQ